MSCTDPSYGSVLNRVTVHSTDIPAATFLVNEYSRKQAFNSDRTYILANSSNGFWIVYNASTYAKVKQLSGPAGDCEPQWNISDPDKFYYLDTNGGTTLKQYTVSTDAIATVANFGGGRLPWPTAAHIWTRAEGSPSSDQRYWAFMAQDASFSTLGMFTWDKQTDTILATLSFGETPDHVSMTPSGNYVEVQWWNFQMIGGLSGRTRAYTRDLSDWTYIDCDPNHTDLVKGTNGHDYYVAIDFTNGGDPNCSPANGYVFMRDVNAGWVSHGYATGRTDLFPTYISGSSRSMHFSGRALDVPGYFLFSTYACVGQSPACPQTIDDKIALVPLTASPTIQYIGNTHDKYSTYFTEPHASISRDGTRAVFSSNWDQGGTADEDVDVYVYDLTTPLTVTTTSLPNGTSGVAYSQDVSTVGGTRPITNCAIQTGSLPSNLSIAVNGSADGCTISGTHTGTGVSTFTVRVTDTAPSIADSGSLSITYSAALQIDTASPMSGGTVNSGYATCLSCSGGTPPRTFSCCQAGALPTGLSLATTGCFTGTTTQAGVFSFTARCTDSIPANADKALQITVSSGATLSMRVPQITVGDTYAVFLIGAPGLDATADCQATVKDGNGATVDTVTSTSGAAARTLTSTLLAAATQYTGTFTCDGAQPDVTPYPFRTLATPSGGARTVPLQFGAPTISAARLTVDYDDNEALSTPASVPNTSCSSGCTVNLSLNAGLWYYRHKWQTAGDVVLATSQVSPLQVQ